MATIAAAHAEAPFAVAGVQVDGGSILTGGQRHDITQATALTDGLPAEWVLGDTAFDADHSAPTSKRSALKRSFHPTPREQRNCLIDPDICKERHLVECCSRLSKSANELLA